MYGRGTADMKGSIAAFLDSLDEFFSSNPDLNYRIAILLTSNEEGDASDGFIDKIVDEMIKNDEKIDLCLVGEPTSYLKIGDSVRIGRRGSLGGRLKVLGKQGHIAYPENVKNPIFSASDAIVELKNTVWDNGNAIFQPTSFQISNIHSGTGAKNVVPGELEMFFNFRYSTESSHAKGGTSDVRFIAKMGTEIVELGPLNETIHQIDEHIKISELWTLKNIYTDILEGLNKKLA